MKKAFNLVFFTFQCFLVLAQSPSISVNQLGYLKNMKKYAWVTNLKTTGQSWYIKKVEDKSTVFSGTISNPGSYDEACAENVLRLDFSSLVDDGLFYVEVEGVGKSYEFVISNYCYNDAFKAAVKSYYFQRSGMELTADYAGIWAKPASHINDAYIYDGYSNNQILKGRFVKSTGGWYDAGDFGKKIVPASVALYPFLKLAEFYPDIVNLAEIETPNQFETLPDLLAEAKWELDWFFTMQESDGGVHHLIVTPEFYMGPAQNDPQPRYILTVSTASTADFAAIMALSSRVYKSYLPSFADSCLVAAEKAWGYLKNTPAIFPAGGYSDPQGINGTGAYGDTKDSDERLWASVELYAATNKTEYRQYFENRYSGFYVYGAGDWQSTSNYAFYSWVQATGAETNNPITNTIKNRIVSWAEGVVSSAKSRGFGVALSSDNYYWGSNSVVLNTGMEMLIINKLFNTERYLDIALEQLNYIFGNNSLNLCFLSGFGTHGVRDPHQCINSYDNLDQAPPGFVPGGPNRNPDKWDLALYNYVTQNSLPPAKCYIDKHSSYSGNEVCVVYNSGLVFLSGFFFQTNPDYLAIDEKQQENKILKIYPNPINDSFTVSVPEKYIGGSFEIYNLEGKRVLKQEITLANQKMSMRAISKGIYILKLRFNKNDICQTKLTLP